MAFTPVTRSRFQASLAVGGALFAWWKFGGMVPAILVGLTFVLALLAWVSPRHYAPIQRALDRIVRGILAVFTWITLGLVYFGLFTPWRVWRSLTRNDPLQRRRDAASATYLRPLSPGALGRFDRQF